MPEPWMIITGATGFLGSQLVRQLRREYRIVALGRRDPVEARAPVGPGIEWFRVDIGDFEGLRQVFERVRELGGARLLLHMAAYYDFTGEDNPEYYRTNVLGTENLIRLAEPLQLRRFIFASSIAACPFPQPGGVLTELTPPYADVPYAHSKRAGEELMRRYRGTVPSCIVRPAAVFSEWCEYEPLDVFLRTWCSRRPHARVIAGRGESAVPYLHVLDLLSFFLRVVEKCDELDPAEVLLASPDGATSHLELYRAATSGWSGAPRRPIHLSPGLAAAGIRLRELLGMLTTRMPFERSWMVDYIDLKLNVDASRTRRRIDWAPNPDLEVLDSLRGMTANLRADRREWIRRNRRRGSRKASTARRGDRQSSADRQPPDLG